MIKKTLHIFMTLWCSLASVFGQSATYEQPEALSAQVGKQVVLPINMSNDFDVYGWQFEIVLPDGVTLANGTKASAYETPRNPEGIDVSLKIQKGPNGMQFISYIDGQDEEGNDVPYIGNSGVIINLVLNVSSETALGNKEIKIINNNISNIDGSVSISPKEIIVPINIYDFFNVSAKSADEATGTATISPSGEVESGTSITATATPNAGYSFVNWINAEGTEVSTENPYTFKLAAATALTANFKINKYPVVFINDGVEVQKGDLDFASAITAPENPTKAGYTFLGWYNGETKFVEGATVPVDGVTYTATWQINQYTITFDTKGGNEIAPITLDYNSEITKPANPTKEGYTFDGWDKEIPSNMPAENMTITASWTVNKYEVTFKNGDDVVASAKFDYGTVIALPENNVPTKEGYTLSWEGYTEGMTVPAKDITFTVKWTANEYTITFDSNGGSEVKAITQGYETSVTAPADPTRTGYTFDGWEPAVPETMPLNGVTCVAKWTINQYTLTFDLNGGESAPIANITADYDSDVTVAAPTRTGYTFKGWFPEFTGKVPAANTTYTAQWEVNKYNVTFNTDGGSAIDPVEVEYGSKITLPETPTKEGHTFYGWVNVPETMPAENITLLASWTINQYKVTYMVDENVYQEYTLDYGTDIQVPANPSKSGWVFLGWTSEYTGETVPARDVVYTAQWKQDIITLRFVLWDGYYIEYQYKPGEEITEIPNVPEREGYTFLDWDKDIPDVMPEDVENGIFTITAKWKTNIYIVYFSANDQTISKQELPYGSTIVVPEAPEVEGYTFVGWTPEVAQTVPAKNVWYEAVYEINTYKVTYYLNDEVVNVAEVKYGEAIPAYEPTVEEGMKFDGWQEEIPAVMPATDLEIHGTTSGIETAIKNIVAKFGETFDVYNVSGRLVQRVNSASDISRIPAGMYIINGTKVVIRKD